MTVTNFHEYLSANGKMKQKVVDASGDQIEKKAPAKPPKGGNPYISKSGKKAKDKGGDCPKKGFADLGDKDLKYEPGKGKKEVKIPTAEGFKYDILPVIRETVATDPRFMENIVSDLQKNNLLGILVGELLDRPEVYKQIAEVMAHETYGPKVCRRLATALEEVAPAFHAQDNDEEEEEEDDDDEDMEGEEDEEGDAEIEGDWEDEDEEGEETAMGAPGADVAPAPAVPEGPGGPPAETNPAIKNLKMAMMGRW